MTTIARSSIQVNCEKKKRKEKKIMKRLNGSIVFTLSELEKWIKVNLELCVYWWNSNRTCALFTWWRMTI